MSTATVSIPQIQRGNTRSSFGIETEASPIRKKSTEMSPLRRSYPINFRIERRLKDL
jgi:hypothetical protein